MIKKTICFSNPAQLSLRDGQMVIRLPNNSEKDNANIFSRNGETTRPVEDIGVLVIDNKQVTLTSGLISALLENNCALITCDNRSMPTGMLLPLCGNTIQSERFRNQIDASLPLKKQLWQQTIQAKIQNQHAALESCRLKEFPCMKVWAGEVRSGDAGNVEARAAAFYWRNLFDGLSGLEDFTRNREGCSPNNILNYGYSILRAVIARSLVASGLLPTLGIHHHNRYNAYCLADDIMEPYRPYVDKLVFDIVKDGWFPDYEMTTQMKRNLLVIPTIDVVINGKRSPLMVAAQQTTASLSKCFSGEMRKIDYPFM